MASLRPRILFQDQLPSPAHSGGGHPASRVIQQLSLRYTKWINYTQDRSGHLFQGRFKALLLDADAYLLERVRYVHLNPVRAGMTSALENHPWSGHRAYAGMDFIPWRTTEWVPSMFSEKGEGARRAYQTFVAEGIEGTRNAEFHNGNCADR